MLNTNKTIVTTDHYIIYWTSVHMLIRSLHIVLDNPSNILLISFDHCSFTF